MKLAISGLTATGKTLLVDTLCRVTGMKGVAASDRMVTALCPGKSKRERLSTWLERADPTPSRHEYDTFVETNNAVLEILAVTDGVIVESLTAPLYSSDDLLHIYLEVPDDTRVAWLARTHDFTHNQAGTIIARKDEQTQEMLANSMGMRMGSQEWRDAAHVVVTGEGDLLLQPSVQLDVSLRVALEAMAARRLSNV